MAWDVKVGNDGALKTVSSGSQGTVFEYTFQSPNGSNFILSVGSDGALFVNPSAAGLRVGYWTFQRIQAKIRAYAGLPQETQISTSELQDEINWYLTSAVPIELMAQACRAYWVATVNPTNVPGAGESIPLPDYVVSITEPMTLDFGAPGSSYDPNNFFDPADDDDNTDISFFNCLAVEIEPQRFFQTWPNNQTWTPDQPYYVLYYGRQLLFRPPPDQTYTFRSPALIKPTALANNMDVCPQDVWGQYIAYAVAHKLVAERGDIERSATLLGRKNWAKGLCLNNEGIMDGDLMLRPVPRW